MFQGKKQAGLQRDELPSFPVSPALLTVKQERANLAMSNYLGPGLQRHDLNGATPMAAKSQQQSTALSLHATALNIPAAFTRVRTTCCPRAQAARRGWLNSTHS